MTLTLRLLAPALLAAALAFPTVAPAQAISDGQKTEIEKIIREYLLAHPEVLQEALSELENRQNAAELEKARSAVKENATLIYASPRNVTLGNPQGDVTIVEFFDYNCGFCKKAMADMNDLIKNDPKLKFVLKEFPVLGEGSVQAAQVAVAVRMQDKTGKKYAEFHQKLLGGRGAADKARALAVAKEVGMNMAQIDKDLAGPEVKASIEESMKLAQALGLNGTPSYIVGPDVVVGAVGLPMLQERINIARCGKAAC